MTQGIISHPEEVIIMKQLHLNSFKFQAQVFHSGDNCNCIICMPYGAIRFGNTRPITDIVLIAGNIEIPIDFLLRRFWTFLGYN